MLDVQATDSRGYFMLPQAPEESGYYVYGTPTAGAGQYAHPTLMNALLFVEREWVATESRKFGVGNISLAGGGKFKSHSSHKDGLQADLRPLRVDGVHVPVKYFNKGYDRAATAKLIGLFLSHPSVRLVFFNDLDIPGVRPLFNHDDHFHIEIRG